MKLRNIIVFAALVALYSCNQPTKETNENTSVSKAEVIETSSNTPTTENVADAPKAFAAFKFEESTHDFGEIEQGDVVKHTFQFTNSGDAPLLISDIKTTCGCTTPNYTREPVAPGETGQIDVQFNSAGKAGVQNKVITIYANTQNQRETVSITTSVKVEKAIEGPFKVQ